MTNENTDQTPKIIDYGLRKSTVTQFMLLTAAFVIIVAGMRSAVTILVPFLLSVFLAVISSPPLFWLQSKKVPTWLALLIVCGMVLSCGLVVVVLTGTTVTDFTKSLPDYQANLQTQSELFITWLESTGIELPDDKLMQYINLGSVMKLVQNLLTQFGNLLTKSFLIFLTAVFILLEAAIFPVKLQLALKKPGTYMAQLNKMSYNLKRYLAIKTAFSAATGIFVTIFLLVLKVDYAVFWGLFAFLLNFVPNIGSIIAAIPPMLLALVQHGWKQAIVVGIGFLFVNIIIGNVLEPKIMGKGLGLSTLVVFLSLVFWGWVLGPVGMLLSVPLTMTMKIALEGYPETRWISILLGSETAICVVDGD